MKQTILFLLTLSLLSCNPNSNNPTPGGSNTSSVTLNNTEQEITGTWYLESQHDSFYQATSGGPVMEDTTYTGFGTGEYIDLKNTNTSSYAQTNESYKDYSCGVLLGSTIIWAKLSHDVDVQGWWYYNEGSQRLVVIGHSWEILSSSSTQLVLRLVVTTSGITYTRVLTFKK